MFHKLIKMPSLGFSGKVVICAGAGSERDFRVYSKCSCWQIMDIKRNLGPSFYGYALAVPFLSGAEVPGMKT